MMMVPYMFNEALMDDLFSNDWEHDFDRAMKAAAPRGMFGKRAANVMKTDVRENKDSYDVFVDLPGFKKEDVKLDLDNGYLTISAQRNEELDDKDNEGRYIRPWTFTLRSSFFTTGCCQAGAYRMRPYGAAWLHIFFAITRSQSASASARASWPRPWADAGSGCRSQT